MPGISCSLRISTGGLYETRKGAYPHHDTEALSSRDEDAPDGPF